MGRRSSGRGKRGWAEPVRVGLSRVVNRVHRKETRVLVEKSGIPVADIISADDLARFAQLEREREKRFAVIDCMRAAFRCPAGGDRARGRAPAG